MLAPPSLRTRTTRSGLIFQESSISKNVSWMYCAVCDPVIVFTFSTTCCLFQSFWIKCPVRLISDSVVPDQQSVVEAMYGASSGVIRVFTFVTTSACFIKYLCTVEFLILNIGTGLTKSHKLLKTNIWDHCEWLVICSYRLYNCLVHFLGPWVWRCAFYLLIK